MTYDVIIAGAGSVGVPAAMALAELGLKPLVVDMHPSPSTSTTRPNFDSSLMLGSGYYRVLPTLASAFSPWMFDFGYPANFAIQYVPAEDYTLEKVEFFAGPSEFLDDDQFTVGARQPALLNCHLGDGRTRIDPHAQCGTDAVGLHAG